MIGGIYRGQPLHNSPVFISNTPYMKRNYLLFLGFLLLLSVACKKEKVISGNNIPAYAEVPTVAIENYVNRLFIDLVGREPADSELVVYVNFLRANDLNLNSRDSLCRFIQNDTTDRPLGRYRDAYCTWLYEKVKNRFFIEFGKDSDFEGFINRVVSEAGASDTTDTVNLNGYAKIEILRLQRVLRSKDNFCQGLIGINDMMSYMINCRNYDEINMQNVNYVRACFNDLLYRIIYSDLNNRYAQSLNQNTLDYLFGQPFRTKDEWAYIMTQSWEFYDGLATWMYLTYLQREPTSDEAFQVIDVLNGNSGISSFQFMQRKLLVTDEYAQFKFIGQ